MSGITVMTCSPLSPMPGWMNTIQSTHWDIRELSWIHVGNGWESRVGIRKVFWGVTEGRHLVDIINQTDQVDQVDGEEKLGQPMINLSTVRDWGSSMCSCCPVS